MRSVEFDFAPLICFRISWAIRGAAKSPFQADVGHLVGSYDRQAQRLELRQFSQFTLELLSIEIDRHRADCDRSSSTHDGCRVIATAGCSRGISVDTGSPIDAESFSDTGSSSDTALPIEPTAGIGDTGHRSSRENDDAAGVISELKLSDHISEVPVPGVAPDSAFSTSSCP